MEVDIYKATIKDLEDSSVLFNEYRMFYGQDDSIEQAKAFLQERIQNNESVIFLAREKSSRDALGFIQLYPGFSSVFMGKTLILNDMYVKRSVRKNGVATALLKKTREFALQENVLNMTLCTASDNINAQSLYEKSGWQRSAFIHYETRVKE